MGIFRSRLMRQQRQPFSHTEGENGPGISFLWEYPSLDLCWRLSAPTCSRCTHIHKGPSEKVQVWPDRGHSAHPAQGSPGFHPQHPEATESTAGGGRPARSEISSVWGNGLPLTVTKSSRSPHCRQLSTHQVSDVWKTLKKRTKAQNASRALTEHSSRGLTVLRYLSLVHTQTKVPEHTYAKEQASGWHLDAK